MKFLFFLTIVVIAAILFFRFFWNADQSIRPFGDNASSSAAAHTDQTPPEKNSAGSGNSAPSGFKGPTGKPRIIGPSGPPPNY